MGWQQEEEEGLFVGNLQKATAKTALGFSSEMVSRR